MIVRANTNSVGSDGDAVVVLDDNINGTNFVFDGYNNKSTSQIQVRFSARNVNNGDVFSITNKGHDIRLHLNPQGFSNLNTTGLSDSYVLETRGINTALIMITGGSNEREKNINIIF